MIDIDNKIPQPPPYSEVRVNADNISEAEWQIKLKKLQKKIRKYNWTKRGDEAIIVQSMRDLAASHTDPEVQTYWNRRANEFEKAPDTDKTAILKDIGRGLAILIAAPFAITGAILLGAGMLLKASGDMLTGGKTSALTK
ncbi:hypothetical protein DFH09DRAFT_1156967 [Mycena vulgaris]|nr:hypothetical protein DFH09DRAFT_1184153 [Mycena vulgaris]KAJ6567428.1 hypothetical protein DFH09DRAFT_1156967 [Mycena vulgaris]